MIIRKGVEFRRKDAINHLQIEATVITHLGGEAGEETREGE